MFSELTVGLVDEVFSINCVTHIHEVMALTASSTHHGIEIDHVAYTIFMLS